MWIFTTREIAIFIYAIIFLGYVLLRRKTRSAAFSVIKAACHIKLVSPFLIMLSFAVVFTWLCTYLPFWGWIYVKDIAFWTLFAGVPVCFNAASRNIEEHYFKNIIIDNLKFAALVEFFTGTFTFHIVIELLLQPLLVFLMILQSTLVKKTESSKKFIEGLVAIFGFGILALTIKSAIDSVGSVQFIDIIVGLVLPVVLSLFYLPFAYFFAVYAKYEILFMRMGFKESPDKKLRFKHRLAVIGACKLSYKRVDRFLKMYVKKMYVNMSKEDFDVILRTFKENK